MIRLRIWDFGLQIEESISICTPKLPAPLALHFINRNFPLITCP